MWTRDKKLVLIGCFTWHVLPSIWSLTAVNATCRTKGKLFIMFLTSLSAHISFSQLSGIFLTQKQPTCLQKLFLTMSKNSCKEYFVEQKQINLTTTTNSKLQMFGAKTCHACTQLEHVFFLTLACMAGVKRWRGRGDLGATPKFPLPFLTRI